MENQNIKYPFSPLKNQEGSTIVYALIVLVLLTILGVSSITTTTTEQKISQNHMYYKLSFYSAEAAREFVPPNTGLYHADNIDPLGPGIDFPSGDGLDNDGDGTVDNETIVEINPTQQFDGNVEYVRASPPPRGSGYDAGTFKAHQYTITANGYGPRNTQRSIEAGFYRIGF